MAVNTHLLKKTESCKRQLSRLLNNPLVSKIKEDGVTLIERDGPKTILLFRRELRTTLAEGLEIKVHLEMGGVSVDGLGQLLRKAWLLLNEIDRLVDEVQLSGRIPIEEWKKVADIEKINDFE